MVNTYELTVTQAQWYRILDSENQHSCTSNNRHSSATISAGLEPIKAITFCTNTNLPKLKMHLIILLHVTVILCFWTND